MASGAGTTSRAPGSRAPTRTRSRGRRIRSTRSCAATASYGSVATWSSSRFSCPTQTASPRRRRRTSAAIGCTRERRRSLRDAGPLGRMSDRLYVATRKGVFTLERRKGRPRARWAITRVHFLADNASIVLPDRREGAVYVALGHGHFGVKLHRSRDGGRKWEPCATPVYPPKPEGIDDREPNSGKPIPWSTELVWALEAGHR